MAATKTNHERMLSSVEATYVLAEKGFDRLWAAASTEDEKRQVRELYAAARKHGRVLVVTEEPVNNSFAQSIAGRISENCFESLDAPVQVIGSKDLPAIPLNSTLEAEMVPNTQKVAEAIDRLLRY